VQVRGCNVQGGSSGFILARGNGLDEMRLKARRLILGQFGRGTLLFHRLSILLFFAIASKLGTIV